MSQKQRKQRSAEMKAAIVLEVLTGKQSVAEAARKHRVQESLIYKWRSEVIDKLPMVFSENTAGTEAEQQIEDLKRLIGQQTIEIEALKKAGRWLSRLSRPGGASSAS